MDSIHISLPSVLVLLSSDYSAYKVAMRKARYTISEGISPPMWV